MKYGLTITLDKDAKYKISVPDLTSTLIELFDSVICYKVYPESGGSLTVLKAKSLWDEFNVKLARNYQHYGIVKPLMKVGHVCCMGSCFYKTAHYHYDSVNGIFLHDLNGEEPHEIYDYCKEHISTASHRLMKTAEILDLTPDRPIYWTKVASWQATKYYWSQKVWKESDGDHEAGYHICSGASPHLGPFSTRAEAIASAKNWRH